jgi:hypothetical protein
MAHKRSRTARVGPRDPRDPKSVLDSWAEGALVVEIGLNGEVRELQGKERRIAAKRWADEMRWTNKDKASRITASDLCPEGS